jgi:hypothetical protein
MRPVLAVVAAAPLLLLGCGSDVRSESVVAKTSAPVIRGSLDTGTTHDTVVYLSFIVDAKAGLGGACTGTLIAPNVIATARHCVSNLDESVYPPRVKADFVPSDISVYLHTNPTGTGIYHKPDGVGARIVHDTSTTLENSDFALLVTAANVSDDYAQIRLAKPPTRGESTFVVGYGVTETYTSSTPQPYQRYWRDNLSIQGVGPLSGYIGSREIYLGESICQGDSGGPVMDHTTGALLAVTSRGGNGSRPTATDPSAGCVGTSAENIFTRVDGFADMIRKTLGEYGRIPWEEGAPKPPEPSGPPPPPAGSLGSPCANSDECASKICVDLGTGTNLCSRECSESSPCPDAFECASGYCIPAAPPPPPAGEDAGPTTDDAGTPPSDQLVPDQGATSSSKGCSIASARAPNETSGRDVGLLSLAALSVVLIARRRRAER